MKLSKDIFIFYNLMILGSLLLGFYWAVLLIQTRIINVYKINVLPILLILCILFLINYYLFGKNVQKIFIKLF